MLTKNEYFPQTVSHPGETLREKLDELEMQQKEFAARTGKPEKTISAILNGSSSITADMAVLFEDVLLIPAKFWLQSQSNYDESIARAKRSLAIQEDKEWAKLFPVREMISKGWITSTRDWSERAAQLRMFFAISSSRSWDNYYCNQQVNVAFRISIAKVNNAHAISAWLRKGELQAAEIGSCEYNQQGFKESLPILKSLMVNHPHDFLRQIQSVCLEVGVKVIYTPNLRKAQISGATRWLKNSPTIQLSGRYKTNDCFWFTFFHEAGHIILHEKKRVFLEDLSYLEKDEVKEKEADDFAKKWTLSTLEEHEILLSMPLTEEKLNSFGKKFNTHPGIIVGRLQHLGKISYKEYNSSKIKVELPN